MASPLLYPALIKPSSLIAKKRKKSIRRKNKIGKFCFQLSETMSLKVGVKRKKATKNTIIT